MVIENKEYNVIFLDVDGPLVKEDAEFHPEETVQMMKDMEGFPEVKSTLARRICYKSLERLKEIVEYADDTIIIETSLWKYKNQEEKDLLNILEFYGLTITGLAPSAFENLSENRGKEVLEALLNIRVKSFVVLDDWPDIQGKKYIHKHLVEVDGTKGITEENVEDAKKIIDMGLEKDFSEVMAELEGTEVDEVENAGLTSHIEAEGMVRNDQVSAVELTS